MATVIIPASHFLRTVKLQYCDLNSAVVREVLQNAIDAGSTSISLSVGAEGWFSVEDNGIGMEKERMVAALLTYGGSAKAENSIGGFGLAKEAILFAHKRYFIHSLNILVEGRALEYEMKTGEFRRGTLIRIEFAEAYQFDFNTFLAAARGVLAESEFINVVVTLNGEVVPGNSKGRTVRVLSCGRVHCRKLPAGQNSSYVTIRAKGLAMFRQYIGLMEGKSVVFEVEGDSKEVFTAMRDRLAHKYADELQNYLIELTTDRKSFDRKNNEPMLIRGDKGVIDEIADEPQPVLRSAVVVECSAQQVGLDAASALARCSKAELAFVPPAACRQGFDFVIQFDSGKYRRVPKKYEPASLSKRLIRLAQLWKYSLKLVMTSNRLRKRFRIGWILNDDEAALFVDGKKGDGVEAFLINPEHHTIPSKWWDWRELFNHLLVLASHEIAHIERTYHDEDFSRRMEELLEKALNSGRGPAWHLRMSRREMV